MRFPRTSRTNTCPICGTHKSKCGWREDDVNFRFCMNLRGGDAPRGWKYLGETKGGLWGMFVPDNRREYTTEERAVYKQRQAQQELKRRLRYAKSLSETERDRQCNKLIDQLSFHPHHREDLRKSGLSDELINAGKFRSVDKFHKLDFEVSYNLAGVDIFGKGLTNKVAGYIVPIWNELHQIVGYQIRNDDSSEDCKDGDEYLGEYELLTWGQFEGMSRHPNRFWDGVKKEIGKINKLLCRTQKINKDSPEPAKTKNKLAYVPGLLPSYGEYVELGCPIITYKNSERTTIWAEFIRKGWTHILDKSAPGLGKSHTAGSMSANNLGMEQLMYLAADHRNPTTITIEKNYYDVFPRHGGLSWDDSRHTPNNRPFLIHPNSSDDAKKIPGNCARSHIFASTREKNLNLESSKNIVCQGCNLLHKCQTNIGDNYGYLAQRMNALKHPQIRLHPDSTPLPDSFDYSQVGIFWDEASVLMRSKNRINVRIDDLHQTIG